MPGRRIGRGAPINWLSQLPDLAPLDFDLFSYAKSIVSQIKITNLKACITEAVASVTPNMPRATWNEADYCLDICWATLRPLMRVNKL